MFAMPSTSITGHKESPPRELHELRDSATLESALIVPHLQKPIPLVRDSITHAWNITPPDLTWDPVRVQLKLLEIAMQSEESGPESALSELDQAQLSNDRSVHELRASLLRQLNRPQESHEELKLASVLPPPDRRHCISDRSGVDSPR